MPIPTLQDFTVGRYEDGTLVISLAPATAVGQWSVQFTMTKRFGSDTPVVTKSCASGFGNGVSGITVVHSGQGIFNVSLTAAEISGIEPGAYACTTRRMDSGHATVIHEGYRLMP